MENLAAQENQKKVHKEVDKNDAYISAPYPNVQLNVFYMYSGKYHSFQHH